MRLTRKLLLFASLCSFSGATSVKYYDTGAQISSAEPSVSFPRIAYRDLSNSTTPADITQPSILPRCRAQELSPGGAAWILLVLGAACVVQLPGSLILPFHQGFYRLAPEIGFLEACAVIVLVFRGVFTFKQKLRTSVKATLALRKALGEGDRWWMDEFAEDGYRYSTTPPEIRGQPFTSRDELQGVPISRRCTPMEAFYKLDPFLEPLSRFSPGRFLALALTLIALVKACVVTGTIRTTALGVFYAFSFFPIEILVWTLLDFRPRPSKGELETEALELAKLMSLLNPYRKYELKSTIASIILSEDWSGPWFFGFTSIELLLVVGMIFWPMSVVISMFELMVWERGGWVFWCLALVIWLTATTLGSAAVYLVSFAVDILGKQKGKVVKWTTSQFEGVSFATVYIGLKMFVILREYLMRYTGEGTRKPDWLDWLN